MKALRAFRNAKSKEFMACSRRLGAIGSAERVTVPLHIRSNERPQFRGLTTFNVTRYEQPLGKTFVRHMSSGLPQHYKIKLPALSPTMESGTLIQWLKKEGDSVSEGEPLCEIQTDKATMTYESPEAGFVAKILLPANTKDIPVGKLIAVIVPESKSTAEFKDFKGDDDAAAAAVPPPAPSAPPAAAAPNPAPSVSYPDHFKIKMPALSPTMEVGTVVTWIKKEGDEINEGDVLCEIQTDKATMAFETPEAGFMAKILIPENTPNISVGKLLCIITPSSGDVGAFKSFVDSANDAAASPSAPAPLVPQPPVSQPTHAPVTSPASTPAKIFLETPSPLPAAVMGSNNTRVMASPLARSIAAEKGVNLSQVRGTGAEGMVTSTDVLNAHSSLQAAATPGKPQAASAQAAAPMPGMQPGADYVDIPISNVRKVIAKRLVQSKQTIPHYYLTSEVELDSVLKLRQDLNGVLQKQAGKSENPATKLSVNDFIIKASAIACKKVPECNSAWMDTSGVIRRYSKVDMSVAVATDDGLVTPIVFEADTKGLGEINANVVSLAKKAREGRLQLNEFQGGTFTISNLGMFGVREFAAVINPPQACILAVGTAVPRLLPAPSSSENADEVGMRQATTMSVTLSCDHRVVDGAVGAQWLVEFKRLMENPSLMLL